MKYSLLLMTLLLTSCASNNGPNYNKGATIGGIAGIFVNEYNLEAELEESIYPAMERSMARSLSDWNVNRNKTKPPRTVEY
jgi:hypothetical protein